MAGDTIKETPMKKLLICLLLLPSLAWGAETQDYARMNPYVLGGGVSAAASTFCSDATHTTQNPSTAVLLCEDLQSNQACWSGATGGDAVCRVTWVVITGTPSIDTTWDSKSSYFTNANSSTEETVKYDT